MTIRNIDTRPAITPEPETTHTAAPSAVDQLKPESSLSKTDSSKTASAKTGTTAAPVMDAKSAERLAAQFMRSRDSFDSQQVQQQINDNFSLFPFPSLPLPLPRIPTPAGMVDFVKLVSVISSAVIDGLKNFGLAGITFGKSVAEAIGNGLRSVKEGVQGVSDLAKGNLGSLKSSVNGFSRDTQRSISSVETAGGKLAASSDPNAQKLGAAAANYTNVANNIVASLKQSMSEYTAAANLTLKKIETGVETFASGLLGMVTGDAAGVEKMRSGQQMMMRALADLGDASEAFNASTSKSLQELAGAKAELDKAAGSLSGLSSTDRRNADTVLRAAATVSGNASRLSGSVADSTSAMSESTKELTASLTDSLNGTWGKIAEAAQALSSNITGVRGNTKTLIDNTKDFRQVADAARRGDPQAEAELKARWGYTSKTLPAPGTLFVDPNYNGKDLVNGQINASKFPVGNPNKTPVIPDSKEYRQQVAAERASKLGIPNDSGKPVPVHMAFEGGGGQGKRFVPALSEMYKLGVVPASASGTSVGAICAAIVAAGADPKKFEQVVHDERISKFLDLHAGGNGGVFKGEEAYKFFDETLRELTGITDRPVTFADLKMPLNIVAAKYTDSNPPAGQRDLSKWENRTFVFSQETTPNTPVALAMRASMAIPGVFDPVEMVDPTTGRTIQLTDGGSLNNLPLGYNHDGLPTVALNLNEPNINHPKSIENNLPTLPAPKGQLNASNVLLNTLYGGIFIATGGGLAKDYQERTNPPKGNFVLNIPVWDLKNPQFADDGLDFKYDPKVDGELDKQTSDVTDIFFKSFFKDLQKPGASGTNLKPLPADISFSRSFEVDGKQWTAKFDGSGNSVNFTSADGQSRSVYIGHRKLENWVIDDAAFGDLNARLGLALKGSLA